MLGSFEAIEAKIDRAGEHLDTLHQELTTWVERRPGRIRSEPKGASLEHLVRLEFDPVPDVVRWGLLFGDAVHNLRAALDHIVYCLAVRVNGGVAPPPHESSLEFPITNTRGFWKDAAASRKLGNLPLRMRAVLQSVQPYKNGANYPRDLLWILRHLDNIEKHRTIYPVGIVPAAYQIALKTLTEGKVTFTTLTRAVDLNDEAPFLRISSPDAVTEVQDEQQVLIDVGIPVFGGQPESVIGLGNQMFDRVSAVARLFETRFFPERWPVTPQ